MQPLQEQIIRFIERNITILGECTKPLVVEHIGNFFAQNSGSDGYLEKFQQIMLLLNNYMAQIQERSVDLVEQLFEVLMPKVLEIGVIVHDTSDIDKQKVKAIVEFYRLLQKACAYTCAFLHSQRNQKHLASLFTLLFTQISDGVDKVAAKIILGIIRTMMIQFNGLVGSLIVQKQDSKIEPSLMQQFGDPQLG